MKEKQYTTIKVPVSVRDDIKKILDDKKARNGIKMGMSKFIEEFINEYKLQVTPASTAMIESWDTIGRPIFVSGHTFKHYMELLKYEELMAETMVNKFIVDEAITLRIKEINKNIEEEYRQNV